MKIIENIVVKIEIAHLPLPHFLFKSRMLQIHVGQNASVSGLIKDNAHLDESPYYRHWLNLYLYFPTGKANSGRVRNGNIHS